MKFCLSIPVLTLLFLLFHVPISLIQAQEAEVEDVNCSTLDNCFACMSTYSNCFWATDGRCLNSCAYITERDVGCYYHWATSSAPDPACPSCTSSSYETTAQSLCSTQQDDLDKIELCAQITDCSVCKDAAVESTDGLVGSQCAWFGESGYCSATGSPDGEFSSWYCLDDESPAAVCHFAGADCNTCVATQPKDSITSCTWWGGTCSDWSGDDDAVETCGAPVTEANGDTAPTLMDSETTAPTLNKDTASTLTNSETAAPTSNKEFSSTTGDVESKKESSVSSAVRLLLITSLTTTLMVSMLTVVF